MKKIFLLIFAMFVTFGIKAATTTGFGTNSSYTIGTYTKTQTSSALPYMKVNIATAGDLATLISGKTISSKSIDKLIIVSSVTLNKADITALEGVGVKNLVLKGVTLGTDQTLSFADNATLESIILPKGITSLTSSMFNVSATSPFNAAFSFTTDADDNTKVDLTAYVNKAGTLRDALYQIITTDNYAKIDGEDGSELESIPNNITIYNYNLDKIKKVTLSGNLVAKDVATTWNFDDNGHYTSTAGSISGTFNGATISSLDLTNAVFTPNSDMVLGPLENGKFSNVKLPISKAMDTIPDNCFITCKNTDFTTLCIPGNYKHIGASAFQDAENLEHIYTTKVDADGNGSYADADKIDNGDKTVTLPNALLSIGTKAFCLVKKFTDVYCLSTTAPTCAVDAFDGTSYYGSGGFNITTPLSRASYKNGDPFAMLHYPYQTTNDEAKNYTDVTRKYSYFDEYQETDGSGNVYMWPNQQEFYKAESQAYAGQTWLAWAESEYGKGTLHKTIDDQKTNNITIDATKTYNTDYTGWHQFVLAAPYDYEDPNTPHWNFSNVKDNDWWTICLPFNLTKAELLKIFGDNKSQYPKVCTLSKVVRNDTKKSVVIYFGEDLVAKATSDDENVITAGDAFMIKPMMPADALSTWIPSNHVFTYKKITYTEVAHPNVPTAIQAVKGDLKTEDTNWKYSFMGCYKSKTMPAYAFYLGWNNDKKCVSYICQGSSASTKKSWNTHTAIVGANLSAKLTTARGSAANNDYIPLHYEVTCSNDLVFENGAKVGLIFEADNSTPTKIDGVEINNAAAATTGKIYNLNGQMMKADGGLDGLPKGIYIINGKKYSVK